MRIVHRNGRSWSLLLCAFIWALIGLGAATGHGGGVAGTWHDALPVAARLCLWWVPAAAAIIVHKSTRWDWVAMMLLMIGPIVRAASYLTAWVLALTGHGGYIWGWYTASYYGALLGLVALTAAYRDHHDDRGGGAP